VSVLVQVVLFALVAPLLHGAMKTLRARFAGRPGPPVVQPYRDLAKLWTKEAILPPGASPVARVAPGLALGVALTFAAALPVVPGAAATFVDVIALAFVLALGRFALTLGALGSGSAFAGMAASREATFSALVEPTLIVALLGGAALGHEPLLSSLASIPFGPAGTLAAAAFFLVLLAETARIPIDNQETHYELTMMHEGLVLEYSGWQLALLLAASHLRQLAFFVLATLLLPGATWWLHLAWLPAIALAIVGVETLFAKVRLFEVPALLSTAFILAAASILTRVLGSLI
jgi:formate hydrogenlyase subunit 4